MNYKYVLVNLDNYDYSDCLPEDVLVLGYNSDRDLDFIRSLKHFWEANIKIRGLILQGHPVQNVLVVENSLIPNVSAKLADLAENNKLAFHPFQEFELLPSYRVWTSPVELFLRLSSLIKVVSDVSSSVDDSKLKNKDNKDYLIWARWLSSNRIYFVDHLI